MKQKSAKGSLKPRNGFVAAALFRKAGAHGKTVKAERQAARMKFRMDLRSGKALIADGYPGSIPN